MSTQQRQAEVQHACVLLSGGFDSTAALLWALANRPDVRAIAFAYGQPHRDAELYAAGRAARGLGVRLTTLALADTLLTGAGLLGGVQDHDPSRTGGTNRAFLPGRNAVFLSVAAAHVCAWWPQGTVELVVGFSKEDAAGFPDCRVSFVAAMATVLRHAVSREIRIAAPFIDRAKADVLRSFASDPAALAHLSASWSCYRGVGPCGACSACVQRAAAFTAVGVVDASAPPVMTGGDPARERCS